MIFLLGWPTFHRDLLVFREGIFFQSSVTNADFPIVTRFGVCPSNIWWLEKGRKKLNPGRWPGTMNPSDSIRDPTNDPRSLEVTCSLTIRKGPPKRRIARKQRETGLSTAGPTRICCVYSMKLVPISIAAVVFSIRCSHEFEIWYCVDYMLKPHQLNGCLFYMSSNPFHDHRLAWKRPCFGGLTFKNRSFGGCRTVYISNTFWTRRSCFACQTRK